MKTSNIFRPELEENIDVLTLTSKDKMLVLHNDDHNTFDWVIETLVEVCRHSTEQAEQCAYIVHFNGKCQVKHGTEERMKKMHLALVQRGLTATIE